MTTEHQITDIVPPQRQGDDAKNSVAGFWRRSVAFWIDVVILGLIGMVVIFLFFDVLIGVGGWSRLVGFVIGSIYFAVLEGGAGRNQSIGKRVMKIKVVRCVDGRIYDLNERQAWIRYVVIAIPTVLGGIAVIDVRWLHGPDMQWLWNANSFVVFGWFLVLGYLFIFNLPGRQSLQDWVVSSVVIPVEAHEAVVHPIKRLHWTVLSCAVVASVPLGIAVSQYAGARLPPGAIAIQQQIEAIPGVDQSNVMFGSNRKIGTSQTQAVAAITIISRDPNLINQDGLTRVAKVAFAASPVLSQQDMVKVVGMTTVNLGIASWTSQSYATWTPSQWAARIAAAH